MSFHLRQLNQNSASDYKAGTSSENAKNSELSFSQSFHIFSLTGLSSDIQPSATLINMKILVCRVHGRCQS